MVLLRKVGDVYSINKVKDNKSKLKKWVLSWSNINSLQNLQFYKVRRNSHIINITINTLNMFIICK